MIRLLRRKRSAARSGPLPSVRDCFLRFGPTTPPGTASPVQGCFFGSEPLFGSGHFPGLGPPPVRDCLPVPGRFPGRFPDRLPRFGAAFPSRVAPPVRNRFPVPGHFPGLGPPPVPVCSLGSEPHPRHGSGSLRRLGAASPSRAASPVQGCFFGSGLPPAVMAGGWAAGGEPVSGRGNAAVCLRRSGGR